MIGKKVRKELNDFLEKCDIKVINTKKVKDSNTQSWTDAVVISPLGYKTHITIIDNGTVKSVWEYLYELAEDFDTQHCAIGLFEENNKYGLDACLREADKIQEIIWDAAQSVEDAFCIPEHKVYVSDLQRIIRKNDALGRNCCH